MLCSTCTQNQKAGVQQGFLSDLKQVKPSQDDVPGCSMFNAWPRQTGSLQVEPLPYRPAHRYRCQQAPPVQRFLQDPRRKGRGKKKKFNKQYSQISAKINIRQRQINISLTNVLSLLSFSGSPGISITVMMSRSTAPSRWQPCRALPAQAAAAPLAARLCPVLPTSIIWAGTYQAGACEQAAIRLTIICLKYEGLLYVLNRIVIIGY